MEKEIVQVVIDVETPSANLITEEGVVPLTEEVIQDLQDATDLKAILTKELSDAQGALDNARTDIEKRIAQNRIELASEELQKLEDKSIAKKNMMKNVAGKENSNMRALSDELGDLIYSSVLKFFEQFKQSITLELAAKDLAKVKDIQQLSSDAKLDACKGLDPKCVIEQQDPKSVVLIKQTDGEEQHIEFTSKESFENMYKSSFFKEQLLSDDTNSIVAVHVNTAELKNLDLNSVENKLETILGNCPSAKEEVLYRNVQIQEQQQELSTIFDENKIDWKQFEQLGFSKDTFSKVDLEKLLNGEKTSVLRIVARTPNDSIISLDAKLRLAEGTDGKLNLVVHGVKKKLDIDTFKEHKFSSEEKEQLMKYGRLYHPITTMINNTSANLIIYIDKDIKELCSVNLDRIKLPQEIAGKRITEEEVKYLKVGKPVLIDGLKDQKGVEFSGWVIVNPETKKLDITKKPPIAVNHEHRQQVESNNNGVRTEGMKKEVSATLKPHQNSVVKEKTTTTTKKKTKGIKL